MEAGEILPAKKPDTSNMVKFCEDCLNGVVWVDDSLICRILTEKVYGEHPRTEIEVRLIGEPVCGLTSASAQGAVASIG